jgi:hypothetical protein
VGTEPQNLGRGAAGSQDSTSAVSAALSWRLNVLRRLIVSKCADDARSSSTLPVSSRLAGQSSHKFATAAAKTMAHLAVESAFRGNNHSGTDNHLNVCSICRGAVNVSNCEHACITATNVGLNTMDVIAPCKRVAVLYGNCSASIHLPTLPSIYQLVTVNFDSLVGTVEKKRMSNVSSDRQLLALLIFYTAIIILSDVVK